MENSRSLGAVILAMQDWFGPPRLAKYLRRAGFRVTSLSLHGSLVARADVDAAVFLPDGASDEQLLQTTKKLLLELRKRFDAIGIPEAPFTRATGLPRLRAHWVKPEVVVQVAFLQWTGGGKMRHSRLLGVRYDKAAREVVREQW